MYQCTCIDKEGNTWKISNLVDGHEIRPEEIIMAICDRNIHSHNAIMAII